MPRGCHDTRAAQWVYVYGEGEVRWIDGEISGIPDISIPLTGVLSSDAGDNANAVIIDGGIPATEQLKGEWLRVVHGDTSANGFRIKSSESKNGNCLLHLHNPPGFKIVPEGAHPFSAGRCDEGRSIGGDTPPNLLDEAVIALSDSHPNHPKGCQQLYFRP